MELLAPIVMLLFFGGTFLLVFVAMMIVPEYNGLIKRRNSVSSVFADVSALMKKRYDLIPNMMEIAKEYAHHEHATFTELAEMRSRFDASPKDSIDSKIQLENQARPLIAKLFAVSESYPELKANDNFIHLQKTLVEVEEQISAGRRAYNSTVLEYNNKVEMVPSSFVASAFKFGKMPWFEVDTAETQAPVLNRV